MSRLSPNEIAHVAAMDGGWAGDDLVTAVAVAMAESNGDPDALGQVKLADGTYAENTDHGLWQISNKWHGPKLAAAGDWRDPSVNARLARAVFDEFVRAGKVGWTAWAVYISGSYLKFVALAKRGVVDPVEPPVRLSMATLIRAAATADRDVFGPLDQE